MKLQYLLLSIFLLASYTASTQCISGDCTNGWGTYKWESGDSYTGQWIGGNRTGLGVYDWQNGAFYYGYFQNGKLEGKGLYLGLDSTQDQIGIFHDGTLAEKQDMDTSGCILGNCLEGAGVYFFESQDLYIGEWKNGSRTGYGRYDWADGSWYIGTFKNAQLDGIGEYHPHGKDVMKGTFINNQFQAPASINGSDSEEEKPVTEAGFCVVMKNVIGDYPNDFQNIKSKKEEGADSWDAAWKITGSGEAKISSGIMGHSTWTNMLYKNKSYDAARAKYDGYVANMKDCGSNCCILLYDSHTDQDDDNKSTTWHPSSVKEGYSDDFNKMRIEIELFQTSDKEWKVVMQVKEASD
jgi:hypothetical protein